MKKQLYSIVQWLTDMQLKIAQIVNGHLNNSSRKKIKLGLISFCVIGGSFSAWLLLQSLQPGLHNKPFQQLRHIKQPKLLVAPAIPDTQLYQKIQRYKRHMDSIGQLIRPGLLDSMRILEEIYQSQKP